MPTGSGYGSVETFAYQGPTAAVQEVVDAVGSQGSFLQIKSPGINATWRLEFAGPIVSCTTVPQSIQRDILANIVQAIESQHGPDAYCNYYGYLVWNTGLAAPSSGGDYSSPACRNLSLPFWPSRRGNNTKLLYSGTCSIPSNNVPLVTYLVTLPQMVTFSKGLGDQAGEPCLTESQKQQALLGSTFLQCGMYNSTYTAQFDFRNGDQQIHVTTRKETRHLYRMFVLRLHRLCQP